LIVLREGRLLMATENGYGKRTEVEDFKVQNRGGSGSIAIQISKRNGAAIGAVQVTDDNEIMLITNGGILVRTKVLDISVVSRNTQGVRLIKLGKGEKLTQLVRIESMEEDEGGDELEGLAEDSHDETNDATNSLDNEESDASNIKSDDSDAEDGDDANDSEQ